MGPVSFNQFSENIDHLIDQYNTTRNEEALSKIKDLVSQHLQVSNQPQQSAHLIEIKLKKVSVHQNHINLWNQIKTALQNYSPPSHIRFDDLPNEVLLPIASFLNLNSIGELKQTDKKFNELLKDSSFINFLMNKYERYLNLDTRVALVEQYGPHLKKLNLTAFKETESQEIQNLIKKCSRLEVLILNDTNVKAEVLEVLPKTIKELQLMDCPELASQDLVLLELLPNLQKISLTGVEVTDEVMKRLPKNIQVLELDSCSNLTEEGLKQLASFKELEALVLDSISSLTDSVLEVLPKKINQLYLSPAEEPALSENGLLNLTFLPQLKVLALYSIDLTDKVLAALPKGIKELSIFDNRTLTERGWAHLQFFPKLEKLYLPNTSVTNATIAALPKKLKDLSLSDNPHLTDEGLIHLGSLLELKKLNLANTQIANQGLKALPQGIKELNLSANPNATEEGLLHLARLKKLEILDLSNTSVTDRVIAALPEGIKELTLIDCQELEGEAAWHLARFPRLEKLTLIDAFIPDEFISWIPESIREINLRDCREFSLEELSQLVSLPNLKLLYLNTNQMTNEQKKQFQERYKELRIYLVPIEEESIEEE